MPYEYSNPLTRDGNKYNYSYSSYLHETYTIAESLFGGNEVCFFVALLSEGCVFANIEGTAHGAFAREEQNCLPY